MSSGNDGELEGKAIKAAQSGQGQVELKIEAGELKARESKQGQGRWSYVVWKR